METMGIVGILYRSYRDHGKMETIVVIGIMEKKLEPIGVI